MSSHLEEYLSYYKSCSKPGYAVLITGDWGVGKTFQVTQAIQENERYYVSLFGLCTTEEVFSAVFAAMFPTTAKVRNTISAAKDTKVQIPGVGSLPIGGLVSGIANAFLRQQVKTDRTIVFDDLERCGLSLKDTLGVINVYVEHHDCRVVVIAHDVKLATDFTEAKEKLFGQTIKVEPQILAAFRKFTSAFVKSEHVVFFDDHMDEIIGIFQLSNVNSLRVLRHLVEDLSRLLKVLSPNQLSNNDAMSELVRLFSALVIEVRRGRLGKKDLIGRGRVGIEYELRRLGHKKDAIEPDKPPFLVAAGQYGSLNLGSTLLTDDVLVRMLIDGCFDQDMINRSLENSAYFIKPSETQPWKIFIQFGELDDQIVEAAMDKLLKQFYNREITNIGEILHLFSLRLMMSENGLIEQDYITVANDCRLYIDDLLKQGRLPAIEPNAGFKSFINRGYDGYAYWVSTEYGGLFQELAQYIIDAQMRDLRSKFPEIAKTLLESVEISGDDFFNKICISQNSGEYALIPILASIPPVDFINAWMRSHPKNWYAIQQALINRYQAGHLERELKEEAEWIQEVITLLEKEVAAANGIRRVRISRIIPFSLKFD